MGKPPAHNPPTIHASAVVLGRFGVLIEGPSGAGKSRLADALIAQTRAHGSFARWIADDRTVVQPVNGTFLASAPPKLAGLKEHAGLGIMDTSVVPRAALDLVVSLKPEQALERMPEPDLWQGSIPRLDAPQRCLSVSVPLVLARLTRL